LLGVPLVVLQRGAEWESKTVRFLTRFVDLAIANSEATRAQLLALGIPEARSRVVYPPIDCQRFHPGVAADEVRGEFGVDGGAHCFGIVGQIIRWKGQDVFLRAARLVLSEFPSARVLIVGEEAGDDGQEFRRELVELAGSLGITRSVVFTGFRRDTPQIMRMLDVVVHASVVPEPFGRVVAEAMAVGRPVVATKPGGPSEIIREGETGFLVPPNDPQALADRVGQLLRDSALASRIGSSGAADVVVRFSAASQACRLGECLLELTGC
jgi:glycosyltransferase involved in cell wall biosynthesis